MIDANRNIGHRNIGYYNSGHGNSGDWNTGHWNSGLQNSGIRNSGDRNSGDQNSGHRNSGDWNHGYRNSGHRNSGNWNSGNWNSGHRNSGDWNSGNFHTGCFNTIDAETAYYFNKPAMVAEWGAAKKPDWLYEPSPTTWVSDGGMTAEEKSEYPEYKATGGYLRVNDMKEEWRKAYEGASEADRELVKKLPNFDAEVFLEITGLDLRDPEETIVHNGRTYRLVEDV